MDKLKEELISSTRLYEGKIINLRLDEVSLPDGKESTREVVENSEAIAVIPYQDGEISLIKQYRSAAKKVVLEVPAGKLEINEAAIDAACRELREETGYKAADLKKIGEFYTSPGFTNERLHLYLATDLTKYESKEDPEEFIILESYSFEQIRELLATNEIEDLKTATLIYYLFNYLNLNS